MTPRMNLNVNCGLWVIMMCQCRLTDYNKHTILMGDVDGGEGCACMGQGDMGTPPTFCSILLCTKNCSKNQV